MNAASLAWMFFRVLRWLCYLGLLAFSLYFISDRAPHINSFGHLTLGTEMLIFGLGVGGMFAGLLELMMRDRAGITRPKTFQLWPGYVQNPSTLPIR